MTYIIYASSGGFNSILARVLGHLKIAEDKGYRPFVDMERHRNYYTESDSVLGTKNVWEYWYEPVSTVTSEEAYKGEWVDSGGTFPHDIMTPLFSEQTWMRTIFEKYVRMRPETLAAIDLARQSVDVGAHVLGVHFRGTDMRTAPGHPLPPSENQVFRRIDKLLDESNFERIFLVSEAEQYVMSFQERYGKRISFLDVSRQGAVNIFVEYPRDKHRYLLGLEALIETHLLAECGGLVCGFSGLSEMAQILGRENMQTVVKIWNGRVPVGPKLLSNYFWSYRERAPRILGGFVP